MRLSATIPARTASSGNRMPPKCVAEFVGSPRSASRRHGYFARKSFHAPIQAEFAHLLLDHALHDAGAETFARGWLDGGAVCFGPAEHNRSVRDARPFDLNFAVGYRKRPVLGGIGRQFMQGHCHRLSRVLFEQQAWTFNAYACLPLSAIRREFLRDDTVQLGSRPPRLHEERMDVCECPDASLDGVFELAGCVGFREAHGRLYDCQHILGPMLGLPSETGNMLLAALALGYIAGNFRCADDFAGRISDR